MATKVLSMIVCLARRKLDVASPYLASPVTFDPSPVRSPWHPVTRHPMCADPYRPPVARHPFVAAASPAPVAAVPDITRTGYGHDFRAHRWRWRRRDDDRLRECRHAGE